MKQNFSGSFSSAPSKKFSPVRLGFEIESAGPSAQTYKECSKLNILAIWVLFSTFWAGQGVD